MPDETPSRRGCHLLARRCSHIVPEDELILVPVDVDVKSHRFVNCRHVGTARR
jgi:hypothetical protein